MSIRIVIDGHIIDNESIDMKVYSGGELKVTVPEIDLSRQYATCDGEVDNTPVYIDARIKSAEELVKLLHVIYVLRINYRIINLTLPYLPYSRQDRVCNRGEINGVQWIIKLLTDAGVTELTTYDVHNPNSIPEIRYYEDSTYHFLPVKNIPFIDIIKNDFRIYGHYDFIIAPDLGAFKRLKPQIDAINNQFTIDSPELKERYDLKLIYFVKDRDPETGKILSLNLSDDSGLLYSFHTLQNNNKFLIIDDICDGGRTFIEVANWFNKVNITPRTLDLYVTHGIFSQGLSIMFKYFDNIITTNSFLDVDDVMIARVNVSEGYDFCKKHLQIIEI